MKAVFIDAPGKIEIRETPDPELLHGQVLVEISRCGVCGSDLSAYKGQNPTVQYPILIGHEPVGLIRELGEGTGGLGLRVGDRVVAEPFTFCGNCPMCDIGRYNDCPSLKTRGTQIPGTMSSLIAHSARQLFKLPDDLYDTEAAMVEPLTIALHALHRAGVREGDNVLITGAGAIGLLAALSCLVYGAAPILVDPVEARLELARQFGIKHVFNNGGGADIIPFLAECTNGYLANVILECSGAGQILEKLTDYIGFGGRIVFVGWPKAPITFNTFWVSRKELDLFGCRNSCNCFPEAVARIAAGQIRARELITEVIRFSEVPDRMPEIAKNPDKYMKVVVDLTE